MGTKFKYGIAAFLILILSCPLAPAAAQKAGEEKPDIQAEDTVPDKLHGTIRGGIRGVAARIDRFFADEHVEDEGQTTSFRVTPRMNWTRGGEFDFGVPFKFKLVLPGIKRKWKIFAMRVIDRDNDLDPNISDTINNDPEGTEEADISSLLGIERDVISKIRQNLKLRSGVKVRLGKVNPFASVRYRYTVGFSSWTVRMIQRGYWFLDTGFGERTSIDLERSLGELTQFRSTSSATWSKTSAGVDLLQRFDIRHLIRKRFAVGLFHQMTGHTRPGYAVDVHTLGLQWRQALLREWILLEIQPQLRFFRVDDYEPNPLLFVSLEVVF